VENGKTNRFVMKIIFAILGQLEVKKCKVPVALEVVEMMKFLKTEIVTMLQKIWKNVRSQNSVNRTTPFVLAVNAFAKKGFTDKEESGTCEDPTITTPADIPMDGSTAVPPS